MPYMHHLLTFWHLFILIRLIFWFRSVQIEHKETICKPVLILCVVADLLQNFLRRFWYDIIGKFICVGGMKQQCFDKADKKSHFVPVFLLNYTDVLSMVKYLLCLFWREDQVEKLLRVLVIAFGGSEHHFEIEKHLVEIGPCQVPDQVLCPCLHRF